MPPAQNDNPGGAGKGFNPDLAFWFLVSAKMHFQEIKKHLHISAAEFVLGK